MWGRVDGVEEVCRVDGVERSVASLASRWRLEPDAIAARRHNTEGTKKKQDAEKARAASPNVALPAAMTPAYNATSTVKDRNVTWRKRRRAPPSPRASDSAKGGAL